jgi:AcrR family transcriptional regulator
MNSQNLAGGTRMERKKEDMRQKIISQAMKLFREQGLNATTMEQIAAEVDIAKGTLYSYFPVKEAILDEYIRRNFSGSNAARVEQIRQLASTRERMRLVFTDLLKGIQSQSEIFERYVAYRMKHWISFRQPADELSGFQLIASEIVHLGQVGGELRSDLPPGVLEDLCEYVFMLAVKEFYLNPESFDAPQAIERSIDVFLNGAKAPAKEV